MKQHKTYAHEESADPLAVWRLCDEVNVIQAVLLYLGVDPSQYCSGITRLGIARMVPLAPVEGFDAVLSALAHAIKAGRLPARIRSDADPPGYAYFPSGIQTQSGKDVSGVEFIYEREPNWSLTTVSVEDLKHWLRGRGVIGGFFFPDRKPTLAAYLDPENEHYPLRLAAAVGAWQAVEDNPNLAKGKSVKTAITNWLTEHAGRLGLLASNGRPSKKAIEEIAKVANWDTKGGAPKTPSN